MTDYFKDIMQEVQGKSRVRSTGAKVDVVYEVFKNTNKYMSPEIPYLCSKTATEVAYYIVSNLSPTQTSIRLSARIIIDSAICKCKTPDTIRKAIKELVDIGAIVKWKDIKEFPDNVVVSNEMYLLNPLMIKNISCESFRNQVKTTLSRINKSTVCYIDEFSAIVYDFNKLSDDDDFEESEFANCVKYNEDE